MHVPEDVVQEAMIQLVRLGEFPTTRRHGCFAWSTTWR